MTSSRFNWIKDRTWLWIALVIVLSVDFMAGFSWMVQNPQASSWDEAGYMNQVNSDTYIFKWVSKLDYLRSFLHVDPSRPPAYRMLAAPFSLAMGLLSPTTLRSISLACFGVTLLLVFFSTSQVADFIAGAFSIVILGLSPAVLFTITTFGTEYPSYLAV